MKNRGADARDVSADVLPCAKRFDRISILAERRLEPTKKLIALLLAVVTLLALNACGGIKDGDMENPDQPDDPPTDPIAAVAEAYGLNLDSTAEQSMSAEMTDSDTLRSIVHDYLQSFTFFSGSEMENLTYEDFRNEIGVDATNYCCREERGSRMNMFTWIASDDSTVKFSAFFRDGKLYATGSTNTNID